ncbi:PTB domain-containing engulfment adapter protein 1 isoform X1 [Scyliorhinus canicula]|uniref:PTB domain-containing engulfment adapter protein 1 isoform X1 n=1 Tax=Scyliorhinus canicula TaxID=7830 RepID=UPI0018F770E4|nr:PTB domain-containing engulfment adapter protein 1 isoform X1 [Scyliorhinus canicula]XP_038645119.1 PTB domain-containing engulfment adapter protein 1 isoform X1 [Scyliorhinus canicula]XP_038645120.1 PTB domain-containing engulfment adapter protein 1 isoform X1 [Scyliorhinus canicula]XP_038645122.1 PTB domain-containing engulfment adapter protein 1 isoform X1 [Scyliorhinus canicula]XP_038645123.1 PTB domain-containing engulfment adapter protein 1 isoform X1 [Scyliorhinus canicula]
MNRAFNRKRDKTWMHSPEALTKHFISYTVKFLGNAEVEQPKGTEIVKDAVRKLKFARHIKKSEGQKTPKVELQISIYGVKILDSKTKEVLHNCQLHRISFCADDKTDKKIFTFICKDAESNKHMCYVFDSEKCAEEITLTIGQAFDLAYKKFLETGGKDVETRKQIASLQKRIQELETENIELKKKVQEMEINVKVTQGSSSPLLHISSSSQLQLCQRSSTFFWSHNMENMTFPEIASFTLTPTSPSCSSLTESLLTSPSPKNIHQQAMNGFSIPRPRRGIAPQSPSTDLFDMVPFSPASPLLPTPSSNGTELPPLPVRSSETRKDIFGAEPFDPFISGGGDFPPDIQSKLDEMQEGFKMGLTLEGTVFSLDPLDSGC